MAEASAATPAKLWSHLRIGYSWNWFIRSTAPWQLNVLCKLHISMQLFVLECPQVLELFSFTRGNLISRDILKCVAERHVECTATLKARVYPPAGSLTGLFQPKCRNPNKLSFCKSTCGTIDTGCAKSWMGMTKYFESMWHLNKKETVIMLPQSTLKTYLHLARGIKCLTLSCFWRSECRVIHSFCQPHAGYQPHVTQVGEANSAGLPASHHEESMGTGHHLQLCFITTAQLSEISQSEGGASANKEPS